MPKFLKIFAAALFVSAMIPTPSSNGMTDEEKKQMFLKAREEMHTVQEPEPETPAMPKPKPKPAHSPRATLTPKHMPKLITVPEETPQPHHAATPEPEETAAPVHAPPPPKPSPTPAPTPPPKTTPVETHSPVVIQKSDVKNLPQPPPPPEPRGWWPWSHPVNYKYLTHSVIEEIRRAPVTKGRWRNIVVHNSGTRQGNAKIFDYYHLHTRRMPNGLAYHFVIGNGSSSGDGQIEIGNRWRRQIQGGHVHSDYLNSISLGICLVGDYNRDAPTKRQLEALDELIRYLRQRVGRFEGHVAVVWPHREINPVPTDCPGKRFPYGWLHSKFDLK